MTDDDLARRDTYAIWSREKVRFGDLDRNNHVNNVALCSLLENARVELREAKAADAARDTNFAWVLVTLAVTFKGSMGYLGVIDVGTRPIELGRTSFTLGQGAFDGERCLAITRVKTVCVDRASGRPTPLPVSYRAVLEGALSHL